ncbi:MAG: UvrD-helicase domain-containing protein [Brevinema sp.]
MPLIFDDPSLVYNVTVPLIIEASAGSGKTTILTERWVATFVYQMAWEDKDPLEALAAMVALTFTRKAAAEMKERIRIRLDELFTDNNLLLLLENLQQYSVVKIDAMEAQQRILNSKESIEDFIAAATIGTIDAFINSSLKQNPLELDDDWGFDPEDTAQLERAVYDQLVYDCLYRRVDPELSEYFRLGASLCGFKGWLKFFSTMTQLVKNQGYEQLIDVLKNSQLIPNCPKLTSLSDIYRIFLQNKVEVLSHSLNEEAKAKNLLKDNVQLQGVLAEINEENFVLLYQKTALPAYSYSEFQKDPVRSLRLACRDAAFNLADGMTASLVVLTLPILEEFERRLQEQNKAQGKSSFERNARLFLEALTLGPLAKKLNSRIKYFFADEFQDTSDLQSKMFSIIADKAVAFYVGDPKQSIYLFRGADTTVFQKTVEMFREKNWKTAVLLKNYRSSITLVDATNRLFARVFKDDPVINYTPQITEKHIENSKFCYACIPDADLKKNELDNALFTNILSIIQKERAESREPGDIMVLFYKNKDILNFYNFAKQHDPELPLSSSNRLHLFESAYIKPLLLFLQVVDNPADELNLIALLKSLFFRCDDIKINEWLEVARKENKILFEILPDPQKAFITKLSSIKNRVPLDELVDMLIHETAYETVLKYDPPEALASLNLFLQELQSLYLSKNMSLSAFLEIIEEKTTLSEAEFSGGEGKNIRLMTIHSSKGLESPCVIFAFKKYPILKNKSFFNKDKKPVLPMQSKGRLSFETFGKGKLLETLKQQQLDELFAEAKRLLYVALTRAKDTLYVCGLHPHLEDKTLHNTAFCNQGVFLELFGASAELKDFPLNALAAQKDNPQDFAEEQRYQELKNWESTHLTPLIPQLLSVSLLLDAEFSPKLVWQKFNGIAYTEDLRDLGGEESSLGLVSSQEIGVMVHGILQQFDNYDAQDINDFLMKFYPTWEKGFEKSIQLVKAYWDSSFYQELIKAEKKDKERSIQVLTSKGIIIRAVADLYVADNKKIIVDYKLNIGKNIERYRRQMEYYALMSEKAGYPVDELVLFDLTKAQEHRFSWDRQSTESIFNQAIDNILEVLSKPEGS